MTDKQIIIDGVDVSGCSYYDANADKESHFLHDCKKEHAPCWSCASMPSCLYKKWQRKEQECEELAYENYELNELFDRLKAENEELKETVDDLLHKPEIQDKILWKIDNEALLGSKDAYIYKLEKTLTDIKEIAETAAKCMYATYSDDYTEGYSWLGRIILQKISEVNDGN